MHLPKTNILTLSGINLERHKWQGLELLFFLSNWFLPQPLWMAKEMINGSNYMSYECLCMCRFSRQIYTFPWLLKFHPHNNWKIMLKQIRHLYVILQASSWATSPEVLKLKYQLIKLGKHSFEFVWGTLAALVKLPNTSLNIIKQTKI